MSGRPLAFTDLEIRRAPGFRREGFPLSGFARGINLVHGPNASGKTTTAQALLDLLWPPRPLSLETEIEAGFGIEGEAWRAEIAAGRRRFLRRGAAAEPPPLPAPELRDRYDFSLLDLLGSSGEAFAAALAREAAGGYDVALAAEACAFRREARQARAERQELRQAEERVADLQRRQEELRREEERLAGLRREREGAASAGREAAELRQRLARARAEAAVEKATAELAAFPAVLAKLTGGEPERLADRRERQARLEAERAEAEAEVARLEQQLRDTALPPQGVAPSLLGTLSAEAEELRELEQESARLAAATAGARAAAKAALAELGEGADVDLFARSGGRVPAAVDELLRREEGLRAAERLWSLAGARLEGPGEEQGAPAEGSRLEGAQALLLAWLAAPEPALSRLALAGLGLAALLLAALALARPELDPAWRIAAGLAAAGIGALAARLLLLYGRRSALAAELPRTGVAPPAVWERAAVLTRLDGLAAEMETERRRARDREFWQRLGLDTARLAAERDDLELDRRALAASIGVAPGSALGLAMTAARLGRATAAFEETAAAEARRAEVDGQRGVKAAGIAGRLAPFGYPAPASSAEARAAVEDLKERGRRSAQARADQGREQERLARQTAELARAEREVGELFAALGATPEDEPALLAALASLPAYRQARQDLLLAEQDRVRAAAGMDGDPPGAASVEALEDELARSEATAAREVTIAEEIAGIESLLREARQRRDLEAALARRDGAATALRAAREADYEAVAGWALAAHLRRETRDRHQPPVLSRARALFSEITRRRYELRAAGGEEPLLAAYDAETGREQALHELSSGTRLQLLLAVRMAFVEHQEADCAPPIFLDETLATSDPERTAAVIEAVCALAARGRQVFAFMAQPEEVGKWQEVFESRRREGRPVEHAVIDLAAARRLAAAERRPLAAPPPRASVPPPGDFDRLAYGRLLGVPALDPWAESVGSVHLWHLVADPASLHPLLAAGYELWGPAEALLDHGAAEALGPGSEATLRRAGACARALAAALEAWRIGRGRPVDRAALLASNAVSQVFLDAVDELCARVGGDARLLLEALENGEVKHFFTGKRLDLEAFLEEQRYLDLRPRQSADQIRLAAFAAARADLEAGWVTLERIDDLLAGLPRDQATVLL